MKLRPRVSVLTPTGRRLFSAHQAKAEAMLKSGEAVWESPGIIKLTQSVRVSSEMHLGPIPKMDVEPQPRQHKCSIHPQLHPRAHTVQRAYPVGAIVGISTDINGAVNGHRRLSA